MNLSLIRSMTRSAVFELENGLCFRPAHPFVVTLNGKTVYEACNTNVFSLFSLMPGTEYTVGVQAEGETLSLTFVTEAETFFVDASATAWWPTARPTTPASCRPPCPPAPRAAPCMCPPAATAPPACS